MWKYYLSGVLVSFPVGLVVGLIYFGSYTTGGWENILFAVPGGILAGFIGNWLESYVGKWALIATLALSVVLSGCSSTILYDHL